MLPLFRLDMFKYMGTTCITGYSHLTGCNISPKSAFVIFQGYINLAAVYPSSPRLSWFTLEITEGFDTYDTPCHLCNKVNALKPNASLTSSAHRSPPARITNTVTRPRIAFGVLQNAVTARWTRRAEVTMWTHCKIWNTGHERVWF